MRVDEGTHADHVGSFQRDIVDLHLIDVIRKHITTGNPVTIDSATYFELRRRIAGRFQLHPNQIVVVGSSRLGFSLKREKRFAERQPKDVDVASWTRGLQDSRRTRIHAFWDVETHEDLSTLEDASRGVQRASVKRAADTATRSGPGLIRRS